jgi:hypothetical protein
MTVLDAEFKDKIVPIKDAKVLALSDFPLSLDRRKFKSWAAIVTYDESVAGKLQRNFFTKPQPGSDTISAPVKLADHDIIEFGLDYNQGKTIIRNRVYGTVKESSHDDSLEIEFDNAYFYPTAYGAAFGNDERLNNISVDGEVRLHALPIVERGQWLLATGNYVVGHDALESASERVKAAIESRS